jgi:GDP/UDP-N,N'-diacetylbacillosamine 2-epimerase (hydrolysing)
MKLKTYVITGGRADYGLLKKLINKLNTSKKRFQTKFIVTGSHLSIKHGNTVNEILRDKIKIFKKIDININSDNPEEISINISNGIKKFTKIFHKNKPDLIIILGDRYEVFSVALAAHLLTIPLAHIHGGEVTHGAIDDAFRHSITKMSDLHFVANQEYKKRVIQLGENPKRIFNVGGLGVDCIKINKLFNKKALENKLKIKFLDKNLIITYHPETISFKKQNLDPLFNALKILTDTTLVFTIPNADTHNTHIFKQIKNFVKRNDNAVIFESLGTRSYHSLINISDAVVGNSSSGMAEVPYFRKPTINIGNRQDGRIRVKSIIDVKMKKDEIRSALKKIYSKTFIKNLINIKSPYGTGGASQKIINILKKFNKERLKKLKIKKFYDL